MSEPKNEAPPNLADSVESDIAGRFLELSREMGLLVGRHIAKFEQPQTNSKNNAGSRINLDQQQRERGPDSNSSGGISEEFETLFGAKDSEPLILSTVRNKDRF